MNQPKLKTDAAAWIKLEPGTDPKKYCDAVARLPRAARRQIERQAKRAVRKYKKQSDHLGVRAVLGTH